MSDKKNIERFFQEKFKDFEVNPTPEIWNNIALRLEKKKNKKRIFPIWFKVIGIAASLVIGYFIIDNYSRVEKFDEINTNDVIVDSEKTSYQINDSVVKNNSKEDINDKKLNTKDYYSKQNLVTSDKKNNVNDNFNDKKSNVKDYNSKEDLVTSDKKNNVNDNFNDKKSNIKKYNSKEDLVTSDKKNNVNHNFNDKKSNIKKYDSKEDLVTSDKKNNANDNFNDKKSNAKNYNSKEDLVTSDKKNNANDNLKDKKSNTKNYNSKEDLVYSDKKNNANDNLKDKKSNTKNYNSKEDLVTSDKKNNANDNLKDKKSNTKNYNSKEDLVYSDKKNIANEDLKDKNSNAKNYNSKEDLVYSDKKNIANDNLKDKNSNAKNYNSKEDLVYSKNGNNSVEKLQNNDTSKIAVNKKITSTRTDAIATEIKSKSNQKQQINKKSKSDEILNTTNNNTETTQNNQSKKSKSPIDLENNTDSDQKKSTVIVLINTNESNLEIPKDSVTISEIIENPLDKILKEKQTKVKAEDKAITEKSEKWKVRPNVAPIFMNASAGSPIHDVFADNKKDYENNLSIGLGVDYAISNKFSVRTGVNKFDLGYNTNDIVFYADLSAQNTVSKNNPIQTINMQGDAQNMVIEDQKTGNSPELAMQSQSKDAGYINQRFGYLEVPVEVSYKLIDKKFGIEIITGLSTLFLNNNQVSIVSAGKSTILGDANNLNKIHFSSNIGLGFKYSFWKSFEANFEPTFKYQINTFNDNSGNFNPYFVGLYSGISYRF